MITRLSIKCRPTSAAFLRTTYFELPSNILNIASMTQITQPLTDSLFNHAVKDLGVHIKPLTGLLIFFFAQANIKISQLCSINITWSVSK